MRIQNTITTGNGIVQVLVTRDGFSFEDAVRQVREARNQFYDELADPDDFLMDEFGLEPDYLFDLLG